MANFEPAMAITFKHEGGFVDNPDDQGAATNMGITLALYRRAVNPNATVDDIRYLTAEKAASIYKEYFWDRPGYGEIDDQHLANKVFDLAVNIGVPEVNEMVQYSINYNKIVAGCSLLAVDGVLGSKSYAQLNSGNTTKIYSALISQASAYYHIIAARDNNKQFLTGWLNRLYSDS